MIMMKGNKVTSFSKNQPHITVELIDDNVMVVPARYIEELIIGKQELKLADDNKILILSIISQWYENIKYNQ